MFGSRFEKAIERFDLENGKDPNRVTVDGQDLGRELFFARELSRWVLRLEPSASEVLQLAARSQHLCRWQIPRKEFPLDRAGYLKWRATLKRFHAELSGRILGECGYEPETITKVQELNLKKHFPAGPESRVLEDALCLVFLEHQLGELAARTDREKVINALRKSWGKMTERGREAALSLPLGAFEKELVQAALQEAPAEKEES